MMESKNPLSLADISEPHFEWISGIG